MRVMVYVDVDARTAREYEDVPPMLAVQQFSKASEPGALTLIVEPADSDARAQKWWEYDGHGPFRRYEAHSYVAWRVADTTRGHARAKRVTTDR